MIECHFNDDALFYIELEYHRNQLLTNNDCIFLIKGDKINYDPYTFYFIQYKYKSYWFVTTTKCKRYTKANSIEYNFDLCVSKYVVNQFGLIAAIERWVCLHTAYFVTNIKINIDVMNRIHVRYLTWRDLLGN